MDQKEIKFGLTKQVARPQHIWLDHHHNMARPSLF